MSAPVENQGVEMHEVRVVLDEESQRAYAVRESGGLWRWECSCTEAGPWIYSYDVSGSDGQDHALESLRASLATATREAEEARGLLKAFREVRHHRDECICVTCEDIRSLISTGNQV